GRARGGAATREWPRAPATGARRSGQEGGETARRDATTTRRAWREARPRQGGSRGRERGSQEAGVASPAAAAPPSESGVASPAAAAPPSESGVASPAAAAPLSIARGGPGAGTELAVSPAQGLEPARVLDAAPVQRVARHHPEDLEPVDA